MINVTIMDKSCYVNTRYICYILHMLHMLHSYLLHKHTLPRDEIVRHALMKESCHIYGWVMSHLKMSHVPLMDVQIHPWMSHVTLMNESCLTYREVMSHLWMSLVTHTHMAQRWNCDEICDEILRYVLMNQICHTHGWAISHLWMSHVTLMDNHVTLTDESCHSYEWAMLQTHTMFIDEIVCNALINESCHTCGWVMSHSRMSDVTQKTLKSDEIMRHALLHESCHLLMSPITLQNEPCRSHGWDMLHKTHVAQRRNRAQWAASIPHCLQQHLLQW